MPRLLAAALAAFSLTVPTQSWACRTATPKMQAERQARLDEQRRVKGEYRPIERIRLPDYWVGQETDAYAYIGEVTTRRGKSYRVMHIGSENLIVMCASFFQPSSAAKGEFYVSRRPNAAREFDLDGEQFDGLYRLVHWDGDYIPAAIAAEQSESGAR